MRVQFKDALSRDLLSAKLTGFGLRPRRNSSTSTRSENFCRKGMSDGTYRKSIDSKLLKRPFSSPCRFKEMPQRRVLQRANKGKVPEHKPFKCECRPKLKSRIRRDQAGCSQLRTLGLLLTPGCQPRSPEAAQEREPCRPNGSQSLDEAKRLQSPRSRHPLGKPAIIGLISMFGGLTERTSNASIGRSSS